jgi:hypothetical protein
LALEGVPFGVAASAPVTFTTAAPRNKNRHMCWYGTSGAGKGYSLRVLLSRDRFANGLRIYGIDQDEQQEYAGRFCAYLQGSRVAIRSIADVEPSILWTSPIRMSCCGTCTSRTSATVAQSSLH